MSDRKNITRKDFIEKGAFLGTGLLASVINCNSAKSNSILYGRPDAPYELNDPENIIYSACLNCNTGCGIKVKSQNGVAVKIDGNPYNPFNMVPHIPLESSVADAAKIDAGLCPKGQAGIQNAYDPYRIRKVLKRAGKRGEDNWITLPFDQAVKEIVEGGKLFANVPGEENRVVEGLKSIMAFKDKDASKDMAEDIGKYWNEKDKDKKKQMLNDFKAKYKAHLDKLIDPGHPDFGPKNNQFVFAWGRLKGGRSNFIQRFCEGFGTTNRHGHTTVCQGSLYFTCKAISEQYVKGKFTGGKKFYWQADLEGAKYVLFVGANLFEANYGPTNRAVRLSKNLESGQTKIAVVDPRFSKLASKAHKWLPIKPGEDSALALAIIRWMIENDKIDRNFLRNANKGAAKKNGEKSWCNATWLVEIKDGKPGKFLRAGDNLYVVQNGAPVAFDPNDENASVTGDLFVDKMVLAGGQMAAVKSSLQILKESAEKNSFDKWCEIAGVKPDDVKEVAAELTSYGKQASVDMHRGPAQHTNGFYNVLSWMSINMLLGNFDWKGGMIIASTYGYEGKPDEKKGEKSPFDLTKVKGAIKSFGISSIRHDIDYEKTSIFAGYPAKRNWYPLASDVYEEIIPSIGDAYPYPVKALMLYMGAPTYSLPAGHTNMEVLADVKKLPLFFASDITIGSTTMYADYIFPDLSYLERWEFQGSHPNIPNKIQPIRQPALPPIPEEVTVYGEKMPVCLESVLMALGEKLGIKAFGDNALGDGLHFKRPEDYYIRAVANIAVGAKKGADVPDADAKELEIFRKARRHLPKSVFDEARWSATAGGAWKKVVYILNRGGRFEAHKKTYDGENMKNSYSSLLNMYQEKTASKKYAGTGKSYPGIATYVQQKNFTGETLEKLSDGYDLHMITHRSVVQTKSRTIVNYWLRPILQENNISISQIDADRLGLKTGSKVKIVSATNTGAEWDFKNGKKRKMIGKIKVTQNIRPGVISFELGFGHWATGASDVEVDGKKIKGDKTRGVGVHANAAMWTDYSLRNNTCLIDPVGGSVSFYDTKVKLVKV